MKMQNVRYSRAQLKIQEMAFVLVALMIFLALVSLIYFSIRISVLEKENINSRDKEARELARKFASSPEFTWGASDCSSCIDMDKAIVLKHRDGYNDFWNVDYLSIEKIYPKEGGECTLASYPRCSRITIVNKSSNFGAVYESFAALCRVSYDGESYTKCEIGRIYVSGKGIE